MTTTASSQANALIRDPLFQLNMVFWSLKCLPPGSSFHIDPLLEKAGYYLFALERTLRLPNDQEIISSLQDLLQTQSIDSPVPDIWIRHRDEEADFLIIELKSQGFSAESSNRRQLLKMLVGAADLSLSLGATTDKELPGHVIIVTSFTDTEQMMCTIKQIKTDLDISQLRSAPAAVIGIGYQDDDDRWIWECPEPSYLPQPLQQHLSEPVTVLSHAGVQPEDLVPLFLIPWAPGISGSNSQLASDGLSVLTGRVLTFLLTEIGNATLPINLTLRSDAIVEKATYGLFKYWKGRDKRSMSKKVISIIFNNIESSVLTDKGNEEISIDIPSEQIRDEILSVIEKIDIGVPSSSLEGTPMIQPSLFSGK